MIEHEKPMLVTWLDPVLGDSMPVDVSKLLNHQTFDPAAKAVAGLAIWASPPFDPPFSLAPWVKAILLFSILDWFGYDSYIMFSFLFECLFSKYFGGCFFHLFCLCLMNVKGSFFLLLFLLFNLREEWKWKSHCHLPRDDIPFDRAAPNQHRLPEKKNIFLHYLKSWDIKKRRKHTEITKQNQTTYLFRIWLKQTDTSKLITKSIKKPNIKEAIKWQPWGLVFLASFSECLINVC